MTTNRLVPIRIPPSNLGASFDCFRRYNLSGSAVVSSNGFSAFGLTADKALLGRDLTFVVVDAVVVKRCCCTTNPCVVALKATTNTRSLAIEVEAIVMCV